MNDSQNESEPIKPAEEVDGDIGRCTSPLDSAKAESVAAKSKTPGIIYLSSIPDSMQYNDIYKVFSELGDIGRISLQVGGECCITYQPSCSHLSNNSEPVYPYCLFSISNSFRFLNHIR